MKKRSLYLGASLFSVLVLAALFTNAIPLNLIGSAEPPREDLLKHLGDRLTVWKGESEMFEVVDYKIKDKVTKKVTELGANGDLVTYTVDVIVKLKQDAYELSEPSEKRSLDGTRTYFPTVKTHAQAAAYYNESVAKYTRLINEVSDQQCVFCESPEVQKKKLRETQARNYKDYLETYKQDKYRPAGEQYVIKNVKIALGRDNNENPATWTSQNWILKTSTEKN